VLEWLGRFGGFLTYLTWYTQSSSIEKHDFPLTIQLLGMPHEPDAWWL